jgi:glycosyltransferase involved in cell wall biosynthesis
MVNSQTVKSHDNAVAGAPTTGARNVLVVSTSRMVWGAERGLLGLAPLLGQLGVAVTLASPQGALSEAWLAAGFPHVEFPVADRHGLRDPDGGRPGPRVLAREVSETVGTARRLARLAKAFDIIHSNSLPGHLDCALAGRMARRPVVLELHDIVRPGLGRRVQRAAVGLASCTIAVSRSVGGSIGGHPHRLHVVPQGVDLERFQPGPPDASWRARLSSDPHEPVVGVVGRVDPEKGIRTVLQAMTMLDGPARRSHLAVVGAPARDDGTYEAELRAEAASMLGDRCRFVGPVDEVPAVLRSLDVLVNASASEPFGLSVLEAQACGVPVIGAASGGIPEFVTDGETGLLVAPGRPDALAAGLSRLLGTPGLSDDLTARALNRVVAHHTITARAETVAHLYRSLTPAQAPARR